MRTFFPRAGAAHPEPPSLPGTAPEKLSFVPALASAGGVTGAMVYARLAVSGVGYVPQCNLLRWTGIPCPGCGATRCLAACGRLDFAAAWQWHPLVASLVVAFLAWPVILLIAQMWRVAWPAHLIGQFQRSVTKRSFTAAVIANWLYLCWALPR